MNNTNMSELSYEVQLAARMWSFCIMSCEKTGNLKVSQIHELLENFFTKEQLKEAVDYLSGISSPVSEKAN